MSDVDAEETHECLGCPLEISQTCDFCSADCAFEWGGGSR